MRRKRKRCPLLAPLSPTSLLKGKQGENSFLSLHYIKSLKFGRSGGPMGWPKGFFPPLTNEPRAVVSCAVLSPSGLADVREELRATTRKAQHTPNTLDSLGMIITHSLYPSSGSSPPSFGGSRASGDGITDRPSNRTTTARRSHRRQPF